jgi:translation initiation factor IF-3
LSKPYPPRQNFNQYPNRVNQKIRAREVFVIIGDTNEKLGVLPIQDAISAARKRGLDLVEVAPNASPPVCKILDYGKFRYEQSKRDRDSKRNAATQKIKELKFRMNISEHDYEVKLRHAEVFMMKGMKVKVLMQFRGREMMHQNLGLDLMNRIRSDLAHVGAADFQPKVVGKSINMMLTPLPASKRVRKYSVHDEVEEDSGVPETETEFELTDPADGN